MKAQQIYVFPVEPAPFVDVSNEQLHQQTKILIDAFNGAKDRASLSEYVSVNQKYSTINQESLESLKNKKYFVTCMLNSVNPSTRIVFDIHNIKDNEILDSHEVILPHGLLDPRNNSIYGEVSKWVSSKIISDSNSKLN